MSIIVNKKYTKSLVVNSKEYVIFANKKAAQSIDLDLTNLPYSLRILFENMVRTNPVEEVLSSFKNWLVHKKSTSEIPFMPSRVLMQDFTGVPAVVDLAAMRDAAVKIGKDPLKVNPLINVDLVIDHSVQVDHYASSDSLGKNVQLEITRNIERYQFLKWGQGAFSNFRVVPPGTGICHQVNLEYLAKVVWTKEEDGKNFAYFDSVVGTDSHTTMINGLGVLGWGVGGIEAEAAMLGRSLPMILPEVVGVKLVGQLLEGITATDLVLTITEILRKKGVVGKFVEYFGEGLQELSLADRATIANMAPEYGATCGFFPIDDETIKYLELTARTQDEIALVEAYSKEQLLWRDNSDKIEYSDIITLNLSDIQPSLAGPKRPQDRVNLQNVSSNFINELGNLSKADADINKKYLVTNKDFQLHHGSLVIAAITSCTNTSNPFVMVAAGLLAKKAYELGVNSKDWVKTSLAPGSQVVTEYLKAGGLDYYLDKIGFNVVGYGCTTCIGNSGPLMEEIEETINKNQLVVASVLSGNRNFEGRVHSLVRANYLASPPLVIAYAIAGDININVTTDPLAINNEGKNIYLRDIWPTKAEIAEYLNSHLKAKIFKEKYSSVFTGDKSWQELKVKNTSTYEWDNNSTYINNPPYFTNTENTNLLEIKSARILAIFGDSITTDHISPAGNIGKSSPAAKYLLAAGVAIADFNSYGARRGNHEVMMRGTFANSRIKNEICAGTEGGITINQLTKQQMSIYDAAMEYQKNAVSLVIFAGKEYGTGSSRDWAAKGTSLLGVKAVIAESFERIHRSNLVGMGVLPLVFTDNKTRKDYNIEGEDKVDILGLNAEIHPYAKLKCRITKKDGQILEFEVILQAFTDSEIEYIRDGSVMHSVIKNI